MNKISDVHVGLALKAARHASGWTAKDLSDATGLSASAISKIESGQQSLGFVEAVGITSVLGISLTNFARIACDAGPIADEVSSSRARLKLQLKDLGQRAILGSIAPTS